MANAISDWIGRMEESDELIALGPVQAAAAMLDNTSQEYKTGSPLPPLWHWFFFVPRVAQSGLGDDGHPKRGGFMPPIDLPRRMFGGARVRFVRPLIIGEPAHRRSMIRDISEKSGRSGKLAFVTVAHEIEQASGICVKEEQDIVYREVGGRVAPPAVLAPAPAEESPWSRTVQPDPMLLFRFSALTFNAHRIHYDRDYAMNVEGYPGLVVHGQLAAVLFAELVRASVTHPIAAFSFRVRAPLFDLAPFRIIGSLNGSRVQLEARGPDDQTTMTAEAELA